MKRVLEEALTLVSMVVIGFENEAAGNWPANGKIHQCKSCYRQAIKVRELLLEKKT